VCIQPASGACDGSELIVPAQMHNQTGVVQLLLPTVCQARAPRTPLTRQLLNSVLPAFEAAASSWRYLTTLRQRCVRPGPWS
jgi:hypothetical protein